MNTDTYMPTTSTEAQKTEFTDTDTDTDTDKAVKAGVEVNVKVKVKEGSGEQKADLTTLEKHVIAPRMLKHLIAKGHPEFSGGKQQDAAEYVFEFLESIRAGVARMRQIRQGYPLPLRGGYSR